MTFTYDASQLSTVPLYELRLLIGDTDPASPIFQDEELTFLLTQEQGSINAAAIEAARRAAAKYARLADQTTGKISTRFSQLWEHYRQLAEDLSESADAVAGPYVAGLTHTERELDQQDPDFLQPAFRRGMHSAYDQTGDSDEWC